MAKCNKSWWWALGFALVACGVFAAYRAVHGPWEGSPAWAKYQQVRIGMTYDEVQAVFGSDRDGWGHEWAGGMQYTWTLGPDKVVVWTEMQPRTQELVVRRKGAVILGHEFSNESWWDRCRARLGW